MAALIVLGLAWVAAALLICAGFVLGRRIGHGAGYDEGFQDGHAFTMRTFRPVPPTIGSGRAGYEPGTG